MKYYDNLSRYCKRNNLYRVEVLNKVPISLAWRLVGDQMVTQVSVVRGDFGATSLRDFVGRKAVAVKSNKFNFC